MPKNEELLQYCDQYPICNICPLKYLIPKCGDGWHISMDGNAAQQDAAIAVFNGAKLLKEAMKNV